MKTHEKKRKRDFTDNQIWSKAYITGVSEVPITVYI